VARGSVDKAHDEELEKSDGRKPRSTARAIAWLVVLGFVLAFVIQNDQRVAVHFWFVTDHVRLVWLLVVCLIVGAAGEAGVRRALRARWRGRRLRAR